MTYRVNVNIKRLLSKSVLELANSGIPTPDLDVRILLEAAIEKDNAFVFSHPDYLVTNAQYSRFRRYVRRRKAGEPIAYILGHKEFFGLDFTVNKNVLIPRPETEWLVEASIKYLVSSIKDGGKAKILDMGTGSGCILISVIKNLLNTQYLIHDTNFYATDISLKALRVARKNAKLNDVTNVHFYLSDLFSNKRLPKQFDLIVANLPYVPYQSRIKNKAVPIGRSTLREEPSGSDSMSRQELRIKLQNCHSEWNEESISHEPPDAIFADDHGMAIIKKFLLEAKDKLSKNGMILLEADCRNAKKVSEFAKRTYPQAKVESEKDLAGLDRYISIKK